MSMFDFLKVKEFKSQISELQARNALLDKTIAEIGALDAVQRKAMIIKLDEEIDLKNNTKESILNDIQKNVQSLDDLRDQLVVTEEEILLQSFGLYTPRYDFVHSDEYKENLDKIRSSQKDMIKNGTAATGNMNWTVNGKASEGKKMVKDMQKLLIRAFNSECESSVSKVRYNNFDASKKRITTAHEAISKLGRVMNVSITPQYYQLKIEELHLAFEYQLKKQEEKEEQKRLREQMREEAKLQKEIEEARKKVEKEQTHFLNALVKLNKQLETATEEEKSALLEKKTELESALEDINAQLKDIDYREANQKAGYVYVISNIGAFGENVYKIGVTRRLDPYERVNELGDASVPFDFDAHAMIFCEDAFGLETALHQAFDHRKMNMMNPRREFFKVTLGEIKEVVKENFDKTVEFIDLPEAEQYRLSMKMRESQNAS